MKKAWFLLSILPTMAHAGIFKAKETQKPPVKDVNPANRTDQIQTPSGNFRIAEKELGFFPIADALYWIASENGLSPFVRASVESNGAIGSLGFSSASKEKVNNLDFKWNWGWRVGLGYSIPHDQWDLSFAWTKYQGRAHKSVAVPFTGTDTGTGRAIPGDHIFPSWSIPAPALSALSGNTPYLVLTLAAKWKLHLNLCDLNLGRKFFVSKWLTLRPNVGLRGAFIEQRYQIAYTGLNTNPDAQSTTTIADAVQMKSHFRAAGLLAGLDTQWGLFKRVSLYANADLSLLYGSFRVRQREAATGTNIGRFTSSGESDAIQISDHFHNLKAITDLAIGLSWDQYLANGRFHLGLHVGWEHHLFFGQNQFKKYILDASLITNVPQVNYVALNQDLTLQGGVAGIRLDF